MARGAPGRALRRRGVDGSASSRKPHFDEPHRRWKGSAHPGRGSGRFATIVRGRGTHVDRGIFPDSHRRAERPAFDGSPRSPGSGIPRRAHASREKRRHRDTVRERRDPRPRERDRGDRSRPLTEKVTLSWSEAIPEAARRELRANASSITSSTPRRAFSTAALTSSTKCSTGARAASSSTFPQCVEVEPGDVGGGRDRRLEGRSPERRLRIFLDREVTSELRFAVDYDRSLGSGRRRDRCRFSPLSGVGRQRGMVALVSDPRSSAESHGGRSSALRSARTSFRPSSATRSKGPSPIRSSTSDAPPPCAPPPRLPKEPQAASTRKSILS